jgi:mannose-1-phosphate guanylyltransferase/phosphomannomutase
MKAIIMAGGEGTRLRPVSASKPKPMVELFDKPVLGHIIELLKIHGVTEACLTLKYLPQIITDYYGDGSSCGIHLTYRIEEAPLGTAGSVLNCADFIGADDVLIISGDCVCDFNLKSLLAFHRESGAEATLALYSHTEPLEYGLVVTDASGRIKRFSEKPAWDDVMTDQVNTGIYVLSPDVLNFIPAGAPYDFGRDLFPRLLKENRALFGYLMKGYWCDIGNVSAYLQCCQDVLKGDIRLDTGASEVKPGVWSRSVIPAGAQVRPPVYIGENVSVATGAVIGPGAVIGASSVISETAEISHSVVCGSAIGADAVLCGTIVGRGASIGRGSVLSEGAAIGDRTVIGDNCLVGASAKIWPDKQIPAGTSVTGCVEYGSLKKGVSFTKPGVMRGEVGALITSALCLRLGSAAVMAAPSNRRVGLSWRGGNGARVLSDAFGCGVNAAGGELIRHDSEFAACASYIGQYFSLPLNVFFEEDNRQISISFYDQNGCAITHELERKLESACDGATLPGNAFGASTLITGAAEAYVSAARSEALRLQADQAHPAKADSGFSGPAVAVPGRSPENKALKSALRLLGCDVTERKPGVIVFAAGDGGMTLTATDEEGYRIDSDKLWMISAFIELSLGVSPLTVPCDAPDTVEDLAEAFGVRIHRAGRDKQAPGQHRALCDAVFAAARIAAYLGARGETLAWLRRRTPGFASAIKEVPLRGNRGSVMRGLSAAYSGQIKDSPAGLRIDTDNGIVRISPLRDRGAIRIRAESFKEELAEELCKEFERRAREADVK